MPSRRDYTCNNSIWQPFFASSCISPTEPGWDLTNPHTKRPHQPVRQLVDVAYTRKKVLYSTLLHPTLLYSTPTLFTFSALLYSTLLYSTLLYSTLLCSALSIFSPFSLFSPCTTVLNILASQLAFLFPIATAACR